MCANCATPPSALCWVSMTMGTRRLRARDTRLADKVADYERSVIAAAIAAHGGKLRAVYETLGISRKTLYEKMQKHGLDRRLILEIRWRGRV